MGGGGAARTLLNIINNLDREKFTPILVTLNFEGSYENNLAEDVALIKLPSKRLSRSVFSLANIIRKQKIDIIFSTIPRVNTIAIAAKIVSFSKVKSVVREADNLGGTRLENLKLIGFGLVYKMSDQIISLSEGVKANLIKRYKIKENSIKVIYNPVDLYKIDENIIEGKLEKKDSSYFVNDKKIIITAGRLVEQKDHETLLKAFHLLRKDINSRLIILGDGPLKDTLLKQASDLQISEDVTFVGFKSNPYIYFAKADLFALTSIHEGFSHVIAEALAVGLPVVSTNCKSGPEEVLNYGEYGSLVNVGDYKQLAEEMRKILSLNKEDLQQLKQKGLARARHFEANVIVKEYEKIFIETLNRHESK
jgi:glycosyltransferase involved in cell wall biosynthesis